MTAGIWGPLADLPYWLRDAAAGGHTMTPDRSADPRADVWVCTACGETASYPGVWGLPAGALVTRCAAVKEAS